jgi:hypothetical protein
MAATVGKGGWFTMPGRIATALAAVRGIPGAQPKDIAAPSMTLGARPVVVAGEIASLAAVPDTAVVLATRGRVPRRDVIRLRPEYPGRIRPEPTRAEPALAAVGAAAGLTEFTPTPSQPARP